jgi:hypothetical protein
LSLPYEPDVREKTSSQAKDVTDPGLSVIPKGSEIVLNECSASLDFMDEIGDSLP